MKLGDRMKYFEQFETERCFNDFSPVIIRLDGRGFSKFTKNFVKPYDLDMAQAMMNVSEKLLKESGALVAYQQSDEISLLLPNISGDSQRFFKGKIMKSVSVLSGYATSCFLTEMIKNASGKVEHCLKQNPHFDCRAFNVPDMSEALNQFIWRNMDARRNSVSMLARAKFPHKEVNSKKTFEKLSMLENQNIFYHTYPDNFKFGTFFKKSSVEKIINDQICLRTVIEKKSFPQPTIEELSQWIDS